MNGLRSPSILLSLLMELVVALHTSISMPIKPCLMSPLWTSVSSAKPPAHLQEAFIAHCSAADIRTQLFPAC